MLKIVEGVSGHVAGQICGYHHSNVLSIERCGTVSSLSQFKYLSSQVAMTAI